MEQDMIENGESSAAQPAAAESAERSLTLVNSAPATAQPQKSQFKNALTFPESGYIGVAAEFADVYSRYYESPKPFYFADLLTLIGAALSGRVRVDFGELVTQPRLYTLKVGRSAWGRKSASTRAAEKFMRSALQESGTATAEDVVATPAEAADKCLCILPGVGSAEGLAMAFNSGDHRIVLKFDELRRFEGKANIKGAVLIPMLTELFDSNEYSNSTRDAPKMRISNAHLAFLANTTESNFENMVGASEMIDTGFLNRNWIVFAREEKRIPRPQTVPESELGPIRAKLAACFRMSWAVTNVSGYCWTTIRNCGRRSSGRDSILSARPTCGT